MRKKFLVVFTLVCLLAGGQVFAQAQAEQAEDRPVSLNMIARAVEGGVNQNLVFWMHDHVIPGFEEKMAEQGRDVSVGLIQFGGSDEALSQQYALDLSVGSGQDLMAFDGFWVPEYVEAGYLSPLDQIAGDAVWEWDGWDYIPEGLRQLLAFEGEIYGLGAGTDVRKIYYRKDLFEEAGIDVPWQPESWDDLLDTARTIRDNLDGVTPIQLNAGAAMGEATTMQGWFMALLGAGIHMYNFDDGTWYGEHPAILDALNLYEDIYVNEGLGDSRLQLIAGGRDQTFQGFRDREIAMLVEGDWFWRSVMAPGSEWEPSEGRDEVVGWAAMPAMEPGAGYNGQDFVTISGGTGYTINPNSPNPELAWELLSFMLSYDMQMAYQELEPRIRIRTDVPVVGDPEMSKMAETLLDYSTVRPQFPEYARVSIEAQRMTERVVSGNMNPEEAMSAYARAIEDIVGSENVIRE